MTACISVWPDAGVLCNSQCPSELRLGELVSNSWHLGVKVAIAVLVSGLAVACVAVKLWFCFWILRLEKKQRDYLESLSKEQLTPTHVALQVNGLT